VIPKASSLFSHQHLAVPQGPVRLHVVALGRAVAAAVGIQNPFVRRERDPVGVRDVVDYLRDLAVPGACRRRWQSLRFGILLAPPSPPTTIGEIDGAVLLGRSRRWSAKALPWKLVGPARCACPLCSMRSMSGPPAQVAMTSRPCRSRQAVAADHREFLEQRILALLALVWMKPTRQMSGRPGSRILHEDRDLAVGHPLVDQVRRHVANSRIPLRPSGPRARPR